MTEEEVFEYARENGWYQILNIARNTHTLSDVARMTGRKENTLGIELKAMAALGLVQLVQRTTGTYAYLTTGLGIKFLQEQNKKRGLTYSCLLCGTTTGMPHICPAFYPELR